MSKVVVEERTQGTETSKYLQEKKSKEIPIVAASELGRAQTSVRAHWGCRTHIMPSLIGEVAGKLHHRG